MFAPKLTTARLLLFLFLILTAFAADHGQSLLIKRIVDGDTVALRDGRKIRLIGVDTPELHESKKLDRDAARSHEDKRTIQKLGRRASEFTKKLLQNGHVELEFDPANAVNKNLDKYGRTLAYLWFDCDQPPAEYLQYLQKKGEIWKPKKLMLNRVLIQCGYGNVYTRFPYQYLDEFRECEREAREYELGLWGSVDGLKSDDRPLHLPKKFRAG